MLSISSFVHKPDSVSSWCSFGAGVHVEELYLTSLLENLSIYHCVGVVISIEEATINHFHRELSSAIISNII